MVKYRYIMFKEKKYESNNIELVIYFQHSRDE